MKLVTVKIGQGAGDILASVPYIKARGGNFLYMVKNLPNVPGWHPVNHGGLELLIPFLQSQGLGCKVVTYKEAEGLSFDFDMDERVR